MLLVTPSGIARNLPSFVDYQQLRDARKPRTMNPLKSRLIHTFSVGRRPVLQLGAPWRAAQRRKRFGRRSPNRPGVPHRFSLLIPVFAFDVTHL